MELLITPLALERQNISGSGVVLVNAPVGALANLHAAAPALGAAMATHEGQWSLHTTAHDGSAG